MEKAIRVISIERGHDPREFTLVAFGGGGPLHACALARALSIPNVLVFPNAWRAFRGGHPARRYSAGLLAHRDATGQEIESLKIPSRSWSIVRREDFAAEDLHGVAQRSVDVRYRGQGYELNVS